jgi:hypothetical protein
METKKNSLGRFFHIQENGLMVTGIGDRHGPAIAAPAGSILTVTAGQVQRSRRADLKFWGGTP